MILINNKEYPFDGLIFLDCDGVINSEKWFTSKECKIQKTNKTEKYKQLQKEYDLSKSESILDHKEYQLHFAKCHADPTAVNILNQILEINNLGIIVSSTWRKFEFTLNALSYIGINNYKERFLGITPEGKYVENQSRGLEILTWLKKNNYNQSFVIVDDDADFEVKYSYIDNDINLMDKLLKTSWREGLTEKHIEISKKIISSFTTFFL